MKNFTLVLSLLISSYGANAEDKEIYIIGFKTPALAALKSIYKDKNLALSHKSKIDNEHQQLLSKINQTFKKSNTIIHDYKIASNAISIKLTTSEAKFARSQNGVSQVTKQQYFHTTSDAAAHMIKADTVWSGSSIAPLLGAKGEDIVIAVIDTGINMTHESFSDAPEDGYDFSMHNPLGAGNVVGWCNPTNPNYTASFICNDKLIGAWDFVDALSDEDDGPIDSNFHGSHISGTSAGNSITAPLGGFQYSFIGDTLNAPSISGIAPHAHIIMYDVCDNTIGCPSSAILAAIDQAILDNVDIINISLSGGLQPWATNSISLALLNANNLGIVTSASAGNATAAQPTTLGQIQQLAPWVITAANSMHGRTQSNDVSVLTPIPVPSILQNIYSLLADGVMLIADIQAEIIYSEDLNINNEEGCLIWNNSAFDNAIALIKTGTCSNESKVQLAQDAGALAVIIFQSDNSLPLTMTGINSPTIPSTMIGLNDANNIIDYIQNNSPTITMLEIISETTHKLVSDLGKTLYCSSLRGPNNDFDITKPDLSAPGRDIFSAIAELGQPAPQYFTATGTSQSAAVISGALALLKNSHPDWTPSELKSSMMLTANSDINFEENNGINCAGGPIRPIGRTTADDTGSGILNISNAINSALVMDEAVTNYTNANPNLTGQPKNLNLASLRDNNCSSSCSWTRTLTNRSSIAHTWNISTQTDVTSEIIVSETSFTLQPNESITLEIDFNYLMNSSGQLKYGHITLTDTDGITPNSTLSLVVKELDFIFSNGFE